MQLDWNELRNRLTGPLGYEFALCDSLEQAQGAHGLASSAHAFLNEGIACVLVDLDEPAQQLFLKAREWLSLAISTEERPEPYFPHGTEAIWYSDLALVEWLGGGETPQAALKSCIEHHLEYLSAEAGQDPVAIGLAAVDFVTAQECDSYMNLLKKCRRCDDISDIPRNERQMAKLLCQGERSGIARMLDRFLRKNVASWLKRGHYSTGLRWVRVRQPQEALPFAVAKTMRRYCE